MDVKEKDIPDVTCRYEMWGKIYEEKISPKRLHKWAGRIWMMFRGMPIEVEIIKGDDSDVYEAHPDPLP